MTTTEATTATAELTYSGFNGRACDVAYNRCAVVIDPEDRRVWVYQAVGSGTPACIWHRRAVYFGVPAGTSLEDVERILRENEEIVENVIASYRGCEWDGHNHVGRWEGDDEADTGERDASPRVPERSVRRGALLLGCMRLARSGTE